MYTAAKCCICDKGPFPLKTLYAHLRRVHKCPNEDVTKIQNAIKRAMYDGKEEEPCNICGKIYFSSSGLRTHKRLRHKKPNASGESKKAPHFVVCPICSEQFYSTLDMAEHCGKEHNDGTTDFTIIEKVFNTWSDFEIWREEKELETSTKLVKRTFRKSNTWTTIMYTCQHSRGSTESRDPNKRSRKKTRVCKNCPCFVKVQLHRDGLVEVVSCFGHCGHPHPLPSSATAGASISNSFTVLNTLVQPEDSESLEHDLPSTSASGAYTLDPNASSYESSSQACSNDEDFDIEEEDEEEEGEINDEVIVVDDVTQPVLSEDTVAKEKTLEAYRRFEQRLVQVGELMQMFVEEQRYDLMNKFNDILEILVQQVPPELVSRTNLGNQLKTHTEMT